MCLSRQHFLRPIVYRLPVHQDSVKRTKGKMNVNNKDSSSTVCIKVKEPNSLKMISLTFAKAARL